MVKHQAHPRIQMSDWIKKYPYREPENSGCPISGPADLVMMEQARREAGLHGDLGQNIPVDVFVWSVGDVKQPYLTMMGGVPHREADLPWPQASDGTKLTFVCQLCYLDSKDLFDFELSGDVLLVFLKESQSFLSDDESTVHVEWADADLENPLKEKDMPETGFHVPELSGVIHRTNDYPTASDLFKSLGHEQPWYLTTFQATKIGGAFPQGLDFDVYGWKGLACISYVECHHRFKGAFVGKEDVTKQDEARYSTEDWFGDGGCVYLYENPETNKYSYMFDGG